MIKATEENIGERFIFRHAWDKDGHYLDEGVITSVSRGGTYVFVDYDGADDISGAGVGTLAANLEWVLLG